MTPAPRFRTAIAVAIATTLALGVFAAIFRGPLSASPTAAAGHHGHGVAYRSLLTRPLGAAELQSKKARISEGAPARLKTPCRYNSHGKIVIVSIKRQHAWACSAHHEVLSTPVTTGKAEPGDATPRGRFTVEARVANTVLRPANGNKVHVGYWIPFLNNVYGFHDAPWQSMPYGSKDYRTAGSLGCIHVPPAALQTLFNFAEPGTTVSIH